MLTGLKLSTTRLCWFATFGTYTPVYTLRQDSKCASRILVSWFRVPFRLQPDPPTCWINVRYTSLSPPPHVVLPGRTVPKPTPTHRFNLIHQPTCLRQASNFHAFGRFAPNLLTIYNITVCEPTP